MATAMTVKDVAARVKRLDTLARGLAKELAEVRGNTLTVLLYRERRGCLEALGNALAGVEGAIPPMRTIPLGRSLLNPNAGSRLASPPRPVHHGRRDLLQGNDRGFSDVAVVVLCQASQCWYGRCRRWPYAAEGLHDGLEKPAPGFTGLRIGGSLPPEQVNQGRDSKVRRLGGVPQTFRRGQANVRVVVTQRRSECRDRFRRRYSKAAKGPGRFHADCRLSRTECFDQGRDGKRAALPQGGFRVEGISELPGTQTDRLLVREAHPVQARLRHPADLFARVAQTRRE
jgi:hypothetical protein